MNKKRKILLILIISVCILIFGFSNQEADESSNTSGGIINIILNINPLTKNLDEYRKNDLAESMQYIVRKGAHFTIYTVLGILLMLYLNTYELELEFENKTLISFALGVTYSITDEVHQHFVPGRSCEFKDVCIDGSGVLFGILLVSIILLIYNKTKKRRKTNEC